MSDRLPFGVELTALPDERAVVALAGEVDLYTSPRFREVLFKGIDGGARRVILDLALVTFMDSTAISVLVEGVNRLRPAGGSLAVVCGGGSVRRILEIAGLQRVLELHATREHALHDAAPGPSGTVST
jgi:anti-sigma B factor antagonist